MARAGWVSTPGASRGGGDVDAPERSAEARVAQLMLVAREYLRLADPPEEFWGINMGKTANAFTEPTLSASRWAQVLLGAHLASAAVRLATIDEVLEETTTGTRHCYSDCRAYFRRSSRRGTDTRGSTCSVWFHIMLRDAIGHGEPSGDAGEDPEQKTRYEDRQRCIERTTFGEAHARLQQTANELEAVLAAHGIILPVVR